MNELSKRIRTLNYRNKCKFYLFQKYIFPFKWLQYIQLNAASLCRRRNFTSVSKFCEVAPISLSLALNGLNLLSEMRFEFLFNLIGKSTMAFLTGQSWRVLKSWYTGGSPEQGFWRCFADGRKQSLVSSVAQLANCCLRSSFTCVPVPFDYFCGAGYWSTSPPPPFPLPASTWDVGMPTEADVAPRVGSRDNLTFPAAICVYFTPIIPNYHLCRDAKGKIHASEFEGVWEVNKLELKEECECMFMFASLFN